MKNDRNHVLKITTAAVMIALTCVLTLAVKIPTPTKGYLNLGDCAVLLSGWLLGPVYGAIAGGVGSALILAWLLPYYELSCVGFYEAVKTPLRIEPPEEP